MKSGLTPAENEPNALPARLGRCLRVVRAGGSNAVCECFIAESVSGSGVYTAYWLRAGSAPSAAVLALIAREQDGLRAIGHPNIAPPLLVEDTFDGRTLVAEPYLGAPTLARVLDMRTRLPLNEAVHHGVELFDAVAALHASGLMHGNLDLERVWVVAREDATTTLRVSARTALPGCLVGACEALQRAEESARPELIANFPRLEDVPPLEPDVDVRAAARILYQMLVGSHPGAQGDEPIAPLPRELERVLRGALIADDRAFLPSAAKVRKELVALEGRLFRPAGWLETTAFATVGESKPAVHSEQNGNAPAVEASGHATVVEVAEPEPDIAQQAPVAAPQAALSRRPPVLMFAISAISAAFVVATLLLAIVAWLR